MSRRTAQTFCTVLAVVFLVAGIAAAVWPFGDSQTTVQAPPSPVPAVSSPAVSLTAAGGQYTEPCQRFMRIMGDWADVAVRVSNSPANLGDVTREELESLINQLAAVQPLLPPGIQPDVKLMVDPLVTVRGLILLGGTQTVDFTQGRDAVFRAGFACGEVLGVND